MCFKKKKIIPIQYPIYELDCTKYNGIFCSTRQQWLTHKQPVLHNTVPDLRRRSKWV